ncbi:hypothetical protein NL533_34350, partial [Klebsiella pneumoniae]|nr:hypothetical protein [Klebsiella pneumoniae]
YDSANDLVIDPSGNVITTGYFSDTTDFDPGAGTTNLTATSYEGIFVWKLDASGNLVWARSGTGAGIFDQGHSLALDSNGNIL